MEAKPFVKFLNHHFLKSYCTIMNMRLISNSGCTYYMHKLTN